VTRAPADSGLGTGRQGPFSSQGWSLGWPTGDPQGSRVAGQCAAHTTMGDQHPCGCTTVVPEKTDPLDPEGRGFCRHCGPLCGGWRADGQQCRSQVVNASTWGPRSDGYEFGYCMARHDPSWVVADEAARRGHPGRPVLDATRTDPPHPVPAPAASAGVGGAPPLADEDDLPDLTDGSDAGSVDTRDSNDQIFDRDPAPEPLPAPAAGPFPAAAQEPPPALAWQLAALALGPGSEAGQDLESA
jgi:hypothetical protein